MNRRKTTTAGAAVCPNCGNPVDINEGAFCPYCGAALTASGDGWALSSIQGISQKTL